VLVEVSLISEFPQLDAVVLSVLLFLRVLLIIHANYRRLTILRQFSPQQKHKRINLFSLVLCQHKARGKIFIVFPIISGPVKYIHKNAYSFLNSLQLFRHKNCCILSSRHFFAHINMQMKLHISQSDNELINSPPSDPLGRAGTGWPHLGQESASCAERRPSPKVSALVWLQKKLSAHM
jgi:hypothetical protein